MGLIKAITGTVSRTLENTWLEFFSCDALPDDVVVRKGTKNTKGNNKGEDNIISNGSMIVVNEGQAAAVVENGTIISFTAEPGAFKWDQGSEPSIFSGSFGSSLIATFKNSIERFKFGGDASKDQRVYYFKTLELPGFKFGTSEPLVYDDPKYQTIGVRCFGTVSLILREPLKFFQNISGNIKNEYRLGDLWNSQLKMEFMTYLGQAMAMLSADNIKFSAMPQHQVQLVKYMNQVMNSDWLAGRGIEIYSTSIPSISLDPEYKDKVSKYDDMHMMANPTMAAAHLVASQGDAMKLAAANTGGAMNAFMGMNMAQNAGGMNAGALFDMGQRQQANNVGSQPTSGGWTCGCGATNSGNFCSSCGKQKPAQGWTCACGAANTGKFCSNCGGAQPTSNSWSCTCGTIVEGKFCSNCGKSR